jgi:hypothetical protein
MKSFRDGKFFCAAGKATQKPSFAPKDNKNVSWFFSNVDIKSQHRQIKIGHNAISLVDKSPN